MLLRLTVSQNYCNSIIKVALESELRVKIRESTNVSKIPAFVSYSDEFLTQLRESIVSFVEDHLHLQAWSVDSLGELQFNVSSLKETNTGNNLLARARRSTKMIGGDVDSDTKAGSILTFLYTSKRTLTLHLSLVAVRVLRQLQPRECNCDVSDSRSKFVTNSRSKFRDEYTPNTLRCTNIQAKI